MGVIKKILILGVVLCAIGFTAFKFWEYKFYLNSVPKEFGVYNILYRVEKSWGFGPGGNEIGIRVYELPEKTLRNIEQQGIIYFENLPSNTNGGRERRGHFQNWSETPIKVTKSWEDKGTQEVLREFDRKPPSILNFLSGYGFAAEVDPQIENLGSTLTDRYVIQ